MRIIFFGTSEFAVPALNALIRANMAPIAVVTAPDKPKGRGKNLSSSPIKSLLDSRTTELDILIPKKIDSELIAIIAAYKPDVGIVASYGKILPKTLIELFPKGILNIHPSLLPKYRGPSPIQTAILNGDTETGVTIIAIDEKMDHGPIVAQSRGEAFSSQKITYLELHNMLAELGAELLIGVLPKWIAGEIIPTLQDDALATYTKLLKKEDGKIDWGKSAEKIERIVRAYNPWPGAWTETQKGILKIKKAEIVNENGLSATWFKASDNFPAVMCGKNALKLLIVQPEGKKEMPGDAYMRGYYK